MTRAIAILVLLEMTAAADEPIVLRLATLAPSGTSWARIAHSMAAELEAGTDEQVHIKYYFGGVAGNELEMLDRIQHGQLDGALSAGPMCERIMPSLRIHDVPGLIQNRAEAMQVNNLLRGDLVREAAEAGYTLLGTFGLGPDIMFTRDPVRSLAELRRERIWIWDMRPTTARIAGLMELRVVSTSAKDAGKAYDHGLVDGFVAIPQAALAYQWAAQARHFTDLRLDFLAGCFVIANRAFDRLHLNAQQMLRAVVAKAVDRVEELGRRDDDALLQHLFERQGLTPSPVSESFRSEFFDAVRTARARLGDDIVPAALFNRVTRHLLDYRAEHGGR
jgi:TRAP-type C4-dicarboxylate transport system substrate-binding protein